MTVYAVAREVREECTFLTAGKRYVAVDDADYEGFFYFRDDTGGNCFSAWGGCVNLNGGDWHRIETDADGWAEWKPSKDGESPPDWQEGWEWQFKSGRGEWTVPCGVSVWYTTYTYRYRPRAVAEKAKADLVVEAGSEFDCGDDPRCANLQNCVRHGDRPNADDYRNRAERAEAEAGELRQRVRNLEALICDALLAGGVA